MGFLSKIFGSGKKSEIETTLEEVLQKVLNKSGLNLSFDIKASSDGKEVLFDLYGEDEEQAKDREGMLLDSLQLFLRRVLQHKFPDQRVSIIVDCDSFREEADQALVDLAEKLKGICLKKKKPVYFRAFPPRERKIIHQYLSDDESVKSKSVGDGLYKKIKVFPAGMKPRKRPAGGEKNDSDRDSANRTPRPRKDVDGNKAAPADDQQTTAG